MIIQCEQCDTRFRMADEKLKPGGTKVRCSKCKYVFTVMPPEPEPEQEPVPTAAVSPPAPTEAGEETVDFGSFNMEPVSDTVEPPAATATDAAELDFSSLESESAAAGGGGDELAEDFSFADTSAPADEPAAATDTFDQESQPDEFEVTDQPGGSAELDFGAAFEESSEETAATAAPDEEPAGDFAFGEESGESEPFAAEQAPAGEFDFGEEEPSTPEVSAAGEFSFDEETPAATIASSQPDEFAFGDDTDAGAFDFDDSPAEEPAAPAAVDEFAFGEGASGEFSFDDEPGGGSSSAGWSDDSATGGDSFDFEEPQFETESAPAKSADDLQFGEIDFAQDDDEKPSFESDGDFSGATLAREEEPVVDTPPPIQRQREEAPAREPRDDKPLAAPQIKRKSPVSRILQMVSVLLLLLVLALGGAVGYFYYIDGGLDLNRMVQRFPILQDYIGTLPASAPAQRIALNIAGSTYVNNSKAGQLLVIQGAAVNNFEKARSAITVKGVLLDAQGKVLYQQTVFCGNPLKDDKLATMSFDRIEEAMNNQFGDSLSNMNVAVGAKIPFTIVFRNLPEGIANINVEVVDSKPGTN